MRAVVHFVHFSAKPGGLEVLLPAIIREISDRSFRSFVIRPQGINEINVYDKLNVKVTYGSNNTFIAFFKFAIYVCKHRKDIFHLYNAGPFYLFILKILLARKIIYSIHGTIYWKSVLQKLTRKLFWSLANSKRIIFISNSDYSARVFNEKVIAAAEIKKIYNPIDTDRFYKPEFCSGSETDLKIVFAGRLVEGKNLFLWIEMAEFLLKSGVNAKFNIYGMGELYEELDKRIKKSEYREKIELKGFVPEMEQVYQNSNLLMFLSEFESFGNVAVESILCGVPVVALNIPAMQEIFQDFPVFLVDKNKNIGDEILFKVRHIDRLKSEANMAALNFSGRFGTKQHIEQLSDIYAALSR